MEPIDYPTPGQYLKGGVAVWPYFSQGRPRQKVTQKGIFFCGMPTLRSQNVPDRNFGPDPSAVKALCLSVGPKDGHVDIYVTPSTEAIVCVYFENLLSKVICEVENR